MSETVLRQPDNFQKFSMGTDRDPYVEYRKVVSELPLIYGDVMHAVVKMASGGWFYCYSDFGIPGSAGYGSLELLEREKLLQINRLRPLENEGGIGYFDLTYLGVSFVRECSPNADRQKPWTQTIINASVPRS